MQTRTARERSLWPARDRARPLLLDLRRRRRARHPLRRPAARALRRLRVPVRPGPVGRGAAPALHDGLLRRVPRRPGLRRRRGAAPPRGGGAAAVAAVPRDERASAGDRQRVGLVPGAGARRGLRRRRHRAGGRRRLRRDRALGRPRPGGDGGDRIAARGRAGRRRRVARPRAHRDARRRPGAAARGAAPGRTAHDRGAERRERGVAVAGFRLVPPRPRAPRRALRAVDARRPAGADRVHPDAGRHVPDRRLPAPRPRAQPACDRVAGQAGGAGPGLPARPASDAARDAASRRTGVTEPFLADGASTARQSAVVAASFLLGTALGGLLGLVIGIVLGESAATDSLLAAYSLYLVFALFGGNVRVALVPLIGIGGTDDDLRGRAADAVGRLSAIGVVLAAALVVLSPALGEALRTGDLTTAIASLAILALASGLQVAAASQAAALAAGLRFVASAALYVVASAAALVLATGFMLA